MVITVDTGPTWFCIRSTSIQGAYPGPIVKIQGHRPRWHGLQAVKADLVRILEKLDYVMDLKLFNCIQLGLELHLSLLSIYKEKLGAPLVHTQSYNQSNAKANTD
jgi:hypothetical protein